MSKPCTVCGQDRSKYIFHHRMVCFECDELLFDLEIESEELVAEKKERVRTDESLKSRVPKR